MKTLYNEGRVVGLSAYELYVRQMLAYKSEANIISENEWLAAFLSTNNSMILKIEAGTTAGYHDYMLPEGSDLCGCTTIFGFLFEGSITTGDDGLWAKRVDDYGRLISNNGYAHPVTPGMPEDVPVKDYYMNIIPSFEDQCMQFTKIMTGMMFQPGEWINNVYQVNLTNETDVDLLTEDGQELLADVSDQLALMSLQVDMSKRGFVRLAFKEDITSDFYLFLHGFSHKTIMGGITGFDPLIESAFPENGDFLGPQCFPWGCKITFIYNNEVMSAINSHYQNQLNEMSETINKFRAFVYDVLGELQNTNRKMGNLEQLNTENKESIVAAINEVNIKAQEE